MAASDVIMIAVVLFIFAIGFFVMHYAVNTTINSMLNIPEINSSNATATALQGAKALTNRMDYVIFGLFIALLLSLLITSWFISGYPIFMFIYFIVTVLAVVFSTILSNVWETVSTDITTFSTTVNSFPITNHLLNNLPIYIAIAGFVGIVVMFAKPYTQAGG
jgi:hypothetical protein